MDFLVFYVVCSLACVLTYSKYCVVTVIIIPVTSESPLNSRKGTL
jgi:hypothetical protein